MSKPKLDARVVFDRGAVSAVAKAFGVPAEKKDPRESWVCVSVDSAPLECVSCRHCKKKDEIYVEMPEKGDWEGGGFVLRIGCLCGDKWDKDGDTRTEFLPYNKAVKQWNKMQQKEKK